MSGAAAGRPARLRPSLLTLVFTVSTVAASLASSGCAVVGAVADKASAGTRVKPVYTRLAGQSIGVMVDADRATLIDYPRLQLDVAQGVVAKMSGAQKSDKAGELKGTVFPREANPEAVFAFQRNHPDYDAEPITRVAPRIGVTRLIYIEVDGLSLHPEDVIELYRGSMSATVKVVEVENGSARIAYQDHVSAQFPPTGGEQGRPDLGDQRTYLGTLDEFTTAVIQKFVTYHVS